MDWLPVSASIAHALGDDYLIRAAYPVNGGCTHEAWYVEAGDRRYFVKLQQAHRQDMLAAEVAGLDAIHETGAIRCPKTLCYDSDGSQSWLVMEYFHFASQGKVSSASLGEQLAAMHRHSADHFGFQINNYIGSTDQPNTPDTDWTNFFSEHRLGFQLALAQLKGAPHRLIDSGQRLRDDIPAFFQNYSPMPSLVHGDLWGGNWGATPQGDPVIFDPAVYYGDRETDIAMTELFGGFGERFYQSYRQTWSLDPGYETRKVLYNLYHILNHYNLFNGSYAAQAQDMIDRLLAAIS
ncbi:MAG: fructosamine kinase family protein [Halioglobus sp.]|nr:fructosamine kinase family protein [Halioglobus sp.]